jgi:hypothetical protein
VSVRVSVHRGIDRHRESRGPRGSRRLPYEIPMWCRDSLTLCPAWKACVRQKRTEGSNPTPSVDVLTAYGVRPVSRFRIVEPAVVSCRCQWGELPKHLGLEEERRVRRVPLRASRARSAAQRDRSSVSSARVLGDLDVATHLSHPRRSRRFARRSARSRHWRTPRSPPASPYGPRSESAPAEQAKSMLRRCSKLRSPRSEASDAPTVSGKCSAAGRPRRRASSSTARNTSRRSISHDLTKCEPGSAHATDARRECGARGGGWRARPHAGVLDGQADRDRRAARRTAHRNGDAESTRGSASRWRSRRRSRCSSASFRRFMPRGAIRILRSATAEPARAAGGAGHRSAAHSSPSNWRCR